MLREFPGKCLRNAQPTLPRFERGLLARRDGASLLYRQVVAAAPGNGHGAAGLREPHDGIEFVARLARCRHAQHAIGKVQPVAHIHLTEYRGLGQALQASARKIIVFISGVLMIVLVMGTLMYVVEGPENGFSTIPTSVYWAITTMTTVGFGDITPKTDMGRFIASVMMLLGWGTLAVPTGIVTAEMASQRGAAPQVPTTRTCPECLSEGHLPEAHYCLHCGAHLSPWQREGA